MVYGECVECGEYKRIKAKGLCDTCYGAEYRKRYARALAENDLERYWATATASKGT